MSDGTRPNERRRSGTRRLARAASALACFTVMLLSPAVSHAYTDDYCGIVLAPGGYVCGSSWPHSFDHASAYYPGPPAHHVQPCTYMYNTTNGNIRGGQLNCRWSDAGGYAAVSFGPTYVAQYRAFAYLSPQTCCNHTINAWASTTL